MPTALINGKSDQLLEVADRGLNYGDGIFETIQVRDGVALLWERHLNRMRSGAKRLKIPFDDSTVALFLADCQALVSQSAGHSVLKLILTRGNAQRGYKITLTNPVTRIAMLSAMPAMSQLQSRGISVLFCQTQLARQPLLAGIKHLNRLEQVIARSEWDSADITEGVVCDTQGNLVEGCMSNLFWIKEQTLFTPRLNFSGVEGIVRNLLLELCAKEGKLSICEGFYKRQALLEADEIFMTNSVFDLLAVTQIHVEPSNINGGLPSLKYKFGPKTSALNALLQQYYLREVSS